MKNIKRLEELLDTRANKVSLWDFERKTIIDGNVVMVNLSCMYGFDNFLSFSFLSEIAELMGTKLIDMTNEHHTPGCETCDYGSCSEITLEIREAKPE